MTTSGKALLGGNAVFQLFFGGRLFSEASVPATRPTKRTSFFADQQEGFRTGFAVANPGEVEATGTLTHRDTAGSFVGSSPFILPAKRHAALFVDEMIVGARTGRVEINLDTGAISVTSLRLHSSSVFSTVSVGQPATIDSLFSPRGGIRDRVIAEINRTTSSIDIAIYSFTSDEIRQALVNARARGVQVRIVADSSQANGQGGEIPTLEGMGFAVQRLTGSGGGLMHNKYMIMDRRLLLTGCYNWSLNAEENSFENAIFIEEDEVILDYIVDFERLWAISSMLLGVFRYEGCLAA